MKNYILNEENSIYYECGYSSDNAIFLVIDKERFFITDSRYEIEAKLFAKNCNVIIASNLIQTAKKIIKKSKIKKIFFDPNQISVYWYQNLTNKLDATFVPKPNLSKQKRIIKSNKEIKYIAKAMQLGKDGFDKFAKYLQKNGLNKSEKYLFFKAKEILTSKGKYDVSFDPIVAINQNSSKPHALPTDKKLKHNNLLLVDAGIKYKRYCSDRTCTSVMNKHITFKREQKFSSQLEQKIYNIVYKAQQTAIQKIKTGMKAKDIDKIARDIIDKAGYGKYFSHSTGHGVGLDIHELPNINKKDNTIIQDNMVFTIEPGIYLEDKFGVRIEDTIVIKNNEAIIL